MANYEDGSVCSDAYEACYGDEDTEDDDGVKTSYGCQTLIGNIEEALVSLDHTVNKGCQFILTPE